MELQQSKALCQTLLRNGLVQKQTVQKCDRFQLMVDDLLSCFPNYKNGDLMAINNLKKKIGKMLSFKARNMKISDDSLKKIKVVIFNIINKKMGQKKYNRRIKIGKNRQIYSSDQEEEIENSDKQHEQTGSISPIVQKKSKTQGLDEKKCSKSKIQTNKKRKYKIYDHDFKQQVCEHAVQFGTESASKKFKLSTRKISSWLEAHSLNLLGKGRKALDPAMQFNMSVWVLKKIWEQVPLTQKIIRQKASTMTTNGIKFNGSKGWLQKFFLRHVELKSCFDTRGKIQFRQQCVRYHKSAFNRLLKDYQNLLKIQVNGKLISKNFDQIIYEKKDDQLLKLKQDSHLDKLKVDPEDLYDYQKLQSIQIPTPKLIKYEQQESIYNEQQSQQLSHSSYDQQSGQEQNEDQAKMTKLENSFDESEMNIYEEEQSSQNNKCVKIQVKNQQVQ